MAKPPRVDPATRDALIHLGLPAPKPKRKVKVKKASVSRDPAPTPSRTATAPSRGAAPRPVTYAEQAGQAALDRLKRLKQSEAALRTFLKQHPSKALPPAAYGEYTNLRKAYESSFGSAKSSYEEYRRASANSEEYERKWRDTLGELLGPLATVRSAAGGIKPDPYSASATRRGAVTKNQMLRAELEKSNRRIKEQALEQEIGRNIDPYAAQAAPGLPGRIFRGFVGALLPGPGIAKTLKGEDAAAWELALDAAFLPLPIYKGVSTFRGILASPTAATGALRSAVGLKRASAAGKAGASSAESAKIFKETVQEPLTKGKWRTWSERQLTRGQPKAQSLMGRGLERMVDAARPVTSHLPGVKTEAQQVGRRMKAHLEFLAKMEMADATELGRIAKRMKVFRLSPSMEYALRVVMDGVDPDLRAAEHIGFAAESEGLSQSAHLIHSDLAKASKRFVYMAEDGPRLRPDAPQQMHRALELLESMAGKREEIYKGLGLLMDAEIEARVQATGRVYKGARWQRNELIAQQGLLASSQRAMLKEAAEETMGPEQAQALMTQWDAVARQHVQSAEKRLKDRLKRLERQLDTADEDLPAHLTMDDITEEIDEIQETIAEGLPIDLFYRSLRAQLGIPKGIMDDAVGLEPGVHPRVDPIPDDVWRGLGDSKARAKDIIASGVKLPPELSTPTKLSRAIRRVYRLAIKGQEERDWYHRAGQHMVRVSRQIKPGGHLPNGVTPDQVAQLFAIYSQAADTVANVAFVAKAIRQYQRYGEIFAGRFPKRQSEEAMAVLRGAPWEGRKRSSFYMNIIEDVLGPEEYSARVASGDFVDKPVTVDRWVVRMFAPSLGDVPGAYYDGFEQVLRDMATQLGWDPKELQAAAWVGVKGKELVAELQRRGRGSPRHLAGAGDAFEYGLAKNFPTDDAAGAQLALDTGVSAAETHPRAIRAANEARKPGGGFTLHKDLSPDPSETGYWAAFGAYEFKIPAKGFRAEHLEAYVRAHLPQLRAKTHRIGGWHNPDDGIVYLDISKHFKTKKAALAFAKREGQLAITDIKALKAEDWDKAFPETGLSDSAASAIKAKLRGPQPMMLKGLEKVGEHPAHPDVQLYRDAVNHWAVGMGFTKSARPTELQYTKAENALYDWASSHPNEPLSQKFFELADRAYAAEKELTGDVEDEFAGVFGRQTDEGLHGVTDTRGEGVDIYVDPGTPQPVSTWEHELAHYAEYLEPHSGALRKALGNDPEAWANHFETWLLGGGARSKELKESFNEIAAAMWDEWEQVGRDRPPIPPLVADAFQNMHTYQELKGGRLVGAEDFMGGRAYTAYQRGLPVSMRRPFRSFWGNLRFNSALFGSGVKQSLGKGKKDPTLTNPFRGGGILSGLFRGDVTHTSRQSLQKAVRAGMIIKARELVLKASSEVPERVDDVAIKVNPGLQAPEELRRLFDFMQDAELGRRPNLKELEDIEASKFEALREHYMPSQTLDGEPLDKVAGEIMEGLREPIENIRWVPREMLEAAELLNVPGVTKGKHSGWGKLELVGAGFDAYNDIMKAAYLYLNPAYAPMNLLGNLAMNLMQQGVFLPANLWHGAKLSRELDPGLASLVDELMGRGFAGHITELHSFLVPKNASRALADAIGLVVDLVPRRASFLHEARKMGYKKAEDIERLLKDESLRDDLEYITLRAKDAIIDYDRLNAFEKNVITRMIFIYPWIKGATRYAARFPLEHPYQASAYAWLYLHQQDVAQEEIGDRPYYMDTFMPFKGINDLTEAARLGRPIPESVERFGKDYPVGFNVKQLLPWTTPYDIGKSIEGFIRSDKNAMSPLEMLQPGYQAGLVALSGYDTFSHRQVGPGPGTFFTQTVEGLPLRNAIERLTRSDKERRQAARNAMYPRNETDDWVRTFFGSLAPTPVNPKRANEAVAPDKKKLPNSFEVFGRRMTVAGWARKHKEILGQDPNPQILEVAKAKVEYEHLKEQLLEQLRIEDLTPKQMTALKFALVWELNPKAAKKYRKDYKRRVKAAGPMELPTYDSLAEDLLGWNQLSELNEIIQEIMDAKKQKEFSGSR